MAEYIERMKALNCDFEIPAFGTKLSVARRAVQSYADAIAEIPPADVVPWEWLKKYAEGKRMNFCSDFIIEAMEDYKNA